MLAKKFDYVLTRGAGNVVKTNLVAEWGSCGVAAVLTADKKAKDPAELLLQGLFCYKLTYSERAAWAAARRAIGTRKGEQET